ncbi:MAG: ParB/RepB/Spo0J family partition protein [Alphaproteobacteria bacterium]
MEDANIITRKVPLERVIVGERLRQFRESQVDSLTESISELGLLTPISVYENPDDGDYTLVAGLHRLEACRKLGWPDIDVILVDRLDDYERILWEIDENLMRAELSEGERAEHLLRRKQIFEAKREQLRLTEEDGDKTQYEKGFASETAERTGLTKRHINRSIRRAELVAPDVRDAIRGDPSFRKGVELDALANMSHEDQRRAVAMVNEGKVRTFREAAEQLTAPRAKAKSPPKPTDKPRMKSLLSAWEGADEEARQAFLIQIGIADKVARTG